MEEINRELFGESTMKQKVNRVLEAGALEAAKTLVELATDGINERTRLSAAGMILDRVVGPVGKEETQDSLMDFMKGIEALAKGSKE